MSGGIWGTYRETYGELAKSIYTHGRSSIPEIHRRKGRITGMKRVAHIRRAAVTVLLVSTLFSLTLWTPAVAQIVPPNRNAVSLTFATFSGAPVYQFGFSYGMTPTLDLTAFYSYQSVAGANFSLLDAGIRYHFPVPTPGVDVWLGAGIAGATANVSIPGFGAVGVSSTGLSVGGGASVRLAPTLTGYASGSLLSLGGTSNSIFDLGVMLHFAPQLSGQIGYVNYAGSGAPYFGLNLSFPGRF